jgi:hypothetical protein
MGWSFRGSKSFGLFKKNFSKFGIVFNFGVPGARVGVNAKERRKKYVRGRIPGAGLYYSHHCPLSRIRIPSPRPVSHHWSRLGRNEEWKIVR